MKKLVSALVLAGSFLSLASEWVIHAPIGTNPWIGFNRCSNGVAETLWLQYGVDGTDLSDWTTYTTSDMWLGYVEFWGTFGSPEWTRLGSGALSLSDEWVTTEVRCGDGVWNSWWWQMYDGPPSFSGFSEIDSSLISVGEYWIDWSASGEFRLSSVQPLDFGKWLSDGSINPSWVEPLALKGKGHTKRH